MRWIGIEYCHVQHVMFAFYFGNIDVAIVTCII